MRREGGKWERAVPPARLGRNGTKTALIATASKDTMDGDKDVLEGKGAALILASC